MTDLLDLINLVILFIYTGKFIGCFKIHLSRGLSLSMIYYNIITYYYILLHIITSFVNKDLGDHAQQICWHKI